MDWRSRVRNYGFWVSFAALVLMLLKGLGLEIVDEQYNAIVDFILGVLILLGILNNPTTSHRGYLDDKK